MTAAEQLTFSAEDFLKWESTQDTKHEFADGIAYAMSGAGEKHVTISGNVFAALRNHVRGTPCRAYIADMKLRVEKANAFFYPDVFVTCSESDARREDYKADPVLVIEVLSPTTAAYDRGPKFAHYRQLPSLMEYVLIEPDRISVEIFRRDATGHWVLYPYGPGETVAFTSIGLNLPVEVIYEDAWPT